MTLVGASFPAPVTVVIPTSGRRMDLLRAAVLSALNQRQAEVEVVVVFNGNPIVDLGIQSKRLVLAQSQARGANAARQMGSVLARHPLVALLDDDDLWLVTKLVSQLEYAATCHLRVDTPWVVSCGQYLQTTQESVIVGRAPVEFPTGPVDVGRYLFERHALKRRLTQLQSSTLLFPAWLPCEVPFSESARFHQDWEWVVEVGKLPGAEVHVAPHYGVIYRRGVPGISSSTKWKESARWGSRIFSDEPHLFGEFLLEAPFNMALVEGDLLGAASLIRRAEALGCGRHALTRSVLALVRQGGRQLMARTRNDVHDREEQA